MRPAVCSMKITQDIRAEVLAMEAAAGMKAKSAEFLEPE